ncbi:hypothetical protein [Embleya sp. NPDC001921]
MTSGLVMERLGSAISQRSGEAVIRDVKHIMARELEALDPKVEVRSTDYFNHSFVPDFVLNWGAAAPVSSRDVFLRFDVASSTLGYDLEALGTGDPAFIGISPSPRRNHLSIEAHAEQYPNCLVSDASALEPFTTRTHANVMSEVIRSSVLRGGRGVLVGAKAASLAEESKRIDATLADGPADEVAETLRKLNSSFRESYAVQIERVMKLLWVSHGRENTDFPSGGDTASRLGEEELRYILPFLLDLPHIQSDIFWRELGDALTLRIVESLVNVSVRRNLNDLVNVNLDRLSVRQMALSRHDPDLFSGADQSDWSVVNSVLTLIGPDFRLSFADDRRRFSKRESDGRTPTWTEIQERLGGYEVERLEFSAPTARMQLETSAASVTSEANVEMISAGLGKHSRVNSIYVRESGSPRSIECDFERSIVDSGDVLVDPRVLIRYGLTFLSTSAEIPVRILPDVLRRDELTTGET